MGLHLRYCPRSADESIGGATVILWQEEVLVGELTLIACLDDGYLIEGADQADNSSKTPFKYGSNLRQA